jgi:FtsP/CotA-like multicopper oxidase with cupredoxin domain
MSALRAVLAVGFAVVFAAALAVVVFADEDPAGTPLSARSPERVAAAAAFAPAYPNEVERTGVTREFELTAAPSTAALDAGLDVEVWAYNGVVPGPELRAEVGDTIAVTLTNELPQATSIHWHGVRVPNSMDGVPGVNQDPVAPGASFRYEFIVRDAGTFWFHSHNRGAEQVERGLYGSLVVTDPVEPTFDHDLVWMVDDWLLARDGSLVEDFNAMHEVTHNGRWGNVVTVNGVVAPDVAVAPGDRIRLRIVNASNARVIAPEFEGVEPTGFAVDGMLARRAFDGDAFVLAPGNRVDVVFTMPDAAVSVSDNFNGEGFELATLQPELDPTANRERVAAAPVNAAVPEAEAIAGLGIDHTYSLDFVSDGMAPGWGFNGRTFDDAETLSVESGSVAVIRLVNDSQALHPIHFHGQFFIVTAIDGQPIDEGHLRDTVLVMPGQTIDLALYASDEGTWAVHCHIQEHAEAGMMTLLEVA